MRARLSLKGRALQWLAQREHSRIELRRKLVRQARAEAQAAALSVATTAPATLFSAMLDALRLIAVGASLTSVTVMVFTV